MKRSETQWLARIGVILQLLLGSSFALGQTKTIDITVDNPRPMEAAIGKIEELSGIPINYEDMPVYYSGDIKDVTDIIARSPVPPGGPRTLVARGGQLSAPIVVDATTGRLKDIQAVRTALLAVVSAYNSSNLPGGFDVEYSNGVFFVKPVRYRDATGATRPMTPVLSVPITFPEEARGVDQFGFNKTWPLILAPIESAVGGHVGRGSGVGGPDLFCMPPPTPTPNSGAATGQVELRPWCSVAFGAQNEPASHVLARFLATRRGPGGAPPDGNWDAGLSYVMNFDANPITSRLAPYALNIHQVANSPRWATPPPKPRSAPSPKPQVGFPSRVP